MATHSSVLAWRIPGTGEPGGLPSMGSHRVGHDWRDSAAAAAAAWQQLSYFKSWRWCRESVHSIRQQIWKTEQWPQDWKRSSGISFQYHTIALISQASKVMLKILQARLQQYVNQEPPDLQTRFRKGRGTRDQISDIHWLFLHSEIRASGCAWWFFFLFLSFFGHTLWHSGS